LDSDVLQGLEPLLL